MHAEEPEGQGVLPPKGSPLLPHLLSQLPRGDAPVGWMGHRHLVAGRPGVVPIHGGHIHPEVLCQSQVVPHQVQGIPDHSQSSHSFCLLTINSLYRFLQPSSMCPLFTSVCSTVLVKHLLAFLCHRIKLQRMQLHACYDPISLAWLCFQCGLIKCYVLITKVTYCLPYYHGNECTEFYTNPTKLCYSLKWFLELTTCLLHVLLSYPAFVNVQTRNKINTY